MVSSFFFLVWLIREAERKRARDIKRESEKVVRNQASRAKASKGREIQSQVAKSKSKIHIGAEEPRRKHAAKYRQQAIK